MNGFDSEHKGDRESALRLIQTLLKDRTLVTLELQQQMVDERKDLADTDAGKEVRAEIIKERMRAERMIAEIQEEHKEALQAQDVRSAEALAEVREDYTRKIARLDTAFERIKISTEKLIEEKYEKMLKDQLAHHEKQMHNLRREKESQERKLEQEKKANQERVRMSERHAANLTNEASSPQVHKPLAKTPVFKNKNLYVSHH
jgi:hypothetical protein